MLKPLKTFICYAHEDHEVVNGLKKQLAIFEKKGLLQIWSDGKILAGEHWDKSIKTQLEHAEIILLFISVDFINSDYIEKTELQAALQRHRDGHATLIPIIVRPCHWAEYFDIGQFQALPSKARPILSSHFPHLEEAFFEIASGVKKTAEDFLVKKIAADYRAEEEAIAQKEAVEKSDRQAAAAKLLKSKDEGAWKTASHTDDPEAYEDYLRMGYTLHEAEAHERISELEAAAAKQRAEQKTKEKAAAAKKAKEEEEKRQHEEAKRKRLADLAALAAEARRAKEAEDQRAKEAEAQRAKEAALKNAREAKARKQREEEEAAQKAKAADPFHNLMIPIKGGTFDMGDTFGDGDASEKPIHKVTVPDFHLCKYPVTQAQWKKIMGDNPASFKGDDLPVEQVNWDDAQAFLKKLNEKTGKKYRLPSEAEWEYAAKGGNQSKGFKYAGGNDLKEVGWYSENSGSKTHSVGQKIPNELGLYDMSGNVWEWCEDDWHIDYEGAPTIGLAWVDSPQALHRVIRGGGCFGYAQYCRAAYRATSPPASRGAHLGFRLALSLQSVG